MAAEKLTRTSYRDDDGDPRDGETALAESRRDMEEQLQPLLRVHASTLHGPGVATGLAVTATPGATTLTVGPGVAVDPLGRHLSLAPGGRALLGTNPDPGDVKTTGIVLDLTILTPAPAAGPHHLTLTFTETFDNDAHAQSGGTIYELDHTPRLALHPTTAPAPHPAVVLARVTLAADTTVTTLDPGDRLACPTPTGDLTVTQPHVTPGPTTRTLDERVVGHLTAHPDGGLTLRSTHTHTDGPLTVHGTLTAQGTTDLRGNTTVTGAMAVSADLTVGATLTAAKLHTTGPLTVDGTATVTDVLTTAKALRVGLDPVAGVTITPADTSPNAGFVRFGDGTGWRLHFGRFRDGVAGGPNTETTGVFATIQDNGNVGVGTTTPDTKLTVQADVGSGTATSRPAQLRLRSASNPNSKLEIGYDAVGNFAVIGALTEGVAWRNVVLANNGGNVGIGTTTPDTKLTVQADDGSGTATSRPAQLRLRSASNPNSKLEIGYDAVGNFAVIGALTEGVDWRNIVLANNGGNVGIGTTKPQARLHVSGDVISGDLTSGGTVRGRTVLLSGELATNGLAAMQTPEWGGGVHTWDLFAEGTVAVGPGVNQPFAAWMNRRGEVSGSIKQFVIDHPLDDDRQLVHACIEGAETAVYYRGESALDGDEAVVWLPPYFEALTRPDGRTVLVSPILDDDGHACPLAASRVVDGRFRVRSLGRAPAGLRFCWEVKATRADVEPLDPEPPKRRTNDQER